MKRLRVGIIFGGRSVEHEVSLVSARSMLEAMDRERYEIVPIGITKAGKWLTSSNVDRFLADGVPKESGEHAALVADPSVHGLVSLAGSREVGSAAAAGRSGGLDVVFPLVHGGYGEDGKLQGLLEMADLAYVGSGVLGSAVGMDKEVAKRLCAVANLPQAPYVVVRRSAWGEGEGQGVQGAQEGTQGKQTVASRIAAVCGYPCFVKPSGLGSSVGVSRAGDWPEAQRAITEAFAFDDKVIVEKAIDAREIEVAVLGNEHPEASVCGEVLTTHVFYDYEAKYRDGATRLVIPADLPEPLARRIREIAIRAFETLELAGMARIDFFLDRTTAEPYLNEVNTIPGFTPVSMYPKLWEATGVPYARLIDRLIALALERHAAKRGLRTSYEG